MCEKNRCQPGSIFFFQPMIRSPGARNFQLSNESGDLNINRSNTDEKKNKQFLIKLSDYKPYIFFQFKIKRSIKIYHDPISFRGISLTSNSISSFFKLIYSCGMNQRMALSLAQFCYITMGSCCDSNQNVHYHHLQNPQSSPSPPAQPKGSSKSPNSLGGSTQQQLGSATNQSVIRPEDSSIGKGSSKRQTYLRKTSSINQNAPHLAQYHHVHIVRPPSFIETSGQMAHFQDEQNIARLMNPNLAIRTSNQTYKPNLEWIREEPLTNY